MKHAVQRSELNIGITTFKLGGSTPFFGVERAAYLCILGHSLEYTDKPHIGANFGKGEALFPEGEHT